MKSSLHVSLLFLFAMSSGLSVAAQEKSSITQAPVSPKISYIQDGNLLGGCGCYFSLSKGNNRQSDRYIFGANMDEEFAWMNIDGKDAKLRLVRSGGNFAIRVGARSYEEYRGDGVVVRVDYVVTKVCNQNDEDCESTGYVAAFVVTSGGRKSMIKGKGTCGC